MAGVAAKRHAQAAFQIALERKELEAWRGDLEQLSEVVKDPLLFAFLESPRIHFEEKARILRQRESPRIHFEEKARILRQSLEGLNPFVINLVLLLVSRGRLHLVSDMVIEYGRLVDEHRGMVGREIVLTTRVAPAIIGGLVARVGDKLIDGSTKSRLLALRESLIK